MDSAGRLKNNANFYGTSVDTHPHGGTPDDLLSDITDEFGELYDPCPNNPTFDGLKVDWPMDVVSFVNPPYTRGVIKKWVKKVHAEWKKGKTIVMLIPCYTDTAYFHDYVYGRAELRFLRGRLKFKGYDGKSASFPNLLAIFRGGGAGCSLDDVRGPSPNSLPSSDLTPPVKPTSQPTLENWGG